MRPHMLSRVAPHAQQGSPTAFRWPKAAIHLRHKTSTLCLLADAEVQICLGYNKYAHQHQTTPLHAKVWFHTGLLSQSLPALRAHQHTAAQMVASSPLVMR